MSELHFKYGSEWYLLRFLGYHRQELNKMISKSLGISKDIDWLDFEYKRNSENKLYDSELKALSFLRKSGVHKQLKIDYAKTINEWHKKWPTKGQPITLDAVGIVGEKLILVEAKANTNEIKSSSGSKRDGRKIIRDSLEYLKNKLKIKVDNDWLEKYYQMANRIFLLDFLLSRKIDTYLVYIYFCNDYRRSSTSTYPTNSKEWQKHIEEQDKYLGIKDKNDGALNRRFKIFIDVKGDKT